MNKTDQQNIPFDLTTISNIGYKTIQLILADQKNRRYFNLKNGQYGNIPQDGDIDLSLITPDMLLAFRRQNKIIDSGDSVVFAERGYSDEVMIVSSLDQGNVSFNGGDLVLFDHTLVHATDEEIALNRRLNEPNIIRKYGSFEYAHAFVKVLIGQMKENIAAYEFADIVTKMIDELRTYQLQRNIIVVGDSVHYSNHVYTVENKAVVNQKPSVKLKGLNYYIPEDTVRLAYVQKEDTADAMHKAYEKIMGLGGYEKIMGLGDSVYVGRDVVYKNQVRKVVFVSPSNGRFQLCGVEGFVTINDIQVIQ